MIDCFADLPSLDGDMDDYERLRRLSLYTLRVQSVQTQIISKQSEALSAQAVVLAARNQEPGDAYIVALASATAADVATISKNVSDYTTIIADWDAMLHYYPASATRLFPNYGKVPRLLVRANNARNSTQDQLVLIQSFGDKARAAVVADEAAKALAAQQIASAVAANTQAIVATTDATLHLADAVDTLNQDMSTPDPVVTRAVNDARESVSVAVEYANTATEMVNAYRVSLQAAHFTPADIGAVFSPPAKPGGHRLILLGAVALGSYFLLDKKGA